MALFARLAAAAIFFAGSVITASAAEPSTAPGPDPGAVIRGLISVDWRERQRVEDSLVDQGEAVKPLIQELLKTNDDPEVRGRLEAALKRVEENRLTGPSIVTLHLKDAEPRQAFAELARQSYAELKPFPETLWDEGAWMKVSTDIEHEPFWTAFRKLSDATGLELMPYNDGLRLMRGARTGGPSLVRGAFLIVASQITYNKTIFLGPGQGAGRADFSVHLAAYAEPKLQILRIDPVVKLEQAVDDHGNSLIPDAPDRRGHWGGGQGVWSFFARLKYPAKNPGGRIARLKGSLVFTLQTRTQKIEVPNLLSVGEKAIVVGDVPIVLRDCKKANDSYELRISVAPDAGNAWVRLQQTMQNKLRVLDAEGRPLEHRGGGSHAAGNEIELTAAFARGRRPDGGLLTGEPATMIWEVATETRDIHVPIEFNDLDMRILDN